MSISALVVLVGLPYLHTVSVSYIIYILSYNLFFVLQCGKMWVFDLTLIVQRTHFILLFNKNIVNEELNVKKEELILPFS